MSIASLWVDTGSSLEKVIWAIFVGIVIASVFMWYHKNYIGKVSRYLYSNKIHSPEKAMKLKEMGFDNIFYRHELKNKNSALRKVIYCTNEAEKLKKEDFSNCKFYLPEKLKDKAYFKYRATNTTLPVVIITIIVMFIMANLCVIYIPKILEMFKK